MDQIETHVRVVGILHIVFGVMGLLGAFVLLLVFGAVTGIAGVSGDPDAQQVMPVIGIVGGLLTCIVFVVSVPGTVAGIGLLQHREWARVLALVVSVLELFSFPLGTALGAYSLWVCLHRDAIALFQRSAQRPPA